MSTFSDACRGADRFIAAVLGIEVSEELPNGMCPGLDMPVVLAVCQKPGPHGPHRGDEPPTYREAQR